MKPTRKIAWLNLIIGLMLIGIATYRLRLLGIDYSFKIPVVFFSVLGVSFVYRYFIKPEKKKIDTTKMILIAFWAVFNSLILLKFEGLSFHYYILVILALIWLFQEFIYLLTHRKKLHEFNWLRISGMIILIIEFIFKYQRWPYLGPVLILATAGYIMIGISFIREFKSDINEKGI